MRGAVGPTDSIHALCTALAQATGGAYSVDLGTAAGLTQLAEVVDLLFSQRIVGADVRERLAVHAPAAIMLLLADAGSPYAKLATQCFATVYPRIFLHVCMDTSAASRQLWQVVTAIKQRVAAMVGGDALPGGQIGAAKACQRIIQVQTAPDGDPRLQNRAEINLRALPPHHAFLRAADLDTEANQLFTKLITLLFTAPMPNTVMAVVHVLTRLASMRVQLGKVVVEAFVSWTPAALAACAYVHVRSVENTVRLGMMHILHRGAVEPQTSQLTAALETQKRRMEAATREYQLQHRDALVRKREARRDVDGAVKRSRSSTPTDVAQKRGSGPTAADIAKLPLDRVVDAIIVGLQSVPESRLRAAIHAYTQAPRAAAGPVDPLKMDVGDDELPATRLALPDDDADGVAPLASLEHFELPAPAPLEQKEAHALIVDSVSRICDLGAQLADGRRAPGALDRLSEGHAALWIKLVTRLATRGLDTATSGAAPAPPPAQLVEQADKVRALLLAFVAQSFVRNRTIAQQWLTEEWASDRVRRKAGLPGAFYETWLDRVLESQLQRTPVDEPALSAFLRELPELSEQVLDRMYGLCTEKETLNEGFAVLRELSTARPPLREPICHRVLAVTRNEDRLIRGKAIVTARTWVLQKGPLAPLVLDFARASLALLEQVGRGSGVSGAGGDDAVRDDTTRSDAARDGAAVDGTDMPPAPAARSPPTSHAAALAAAAPEDDIDVAAIETNTLRLMELALVLSVKQPSFFEEVVRIYPHVASPVQAAMEKHVAPVARAAGPNSTALLDVLRNAPEGADALVVAVLRILTERGNTRALAELTRGLVERRGLPISFLLPLVPELDRDAIVAVLPRVVAVLRENTEEHRAAIRHLFHTLVAPALQAAGEAGAPTMTGSLTPVDLMVVLHDAENDIGLKAASTAIQLCFEMKSVFRGDVLTSVLNRLVDEDHMPVLFMRTAIMAAKNFRALANYISTSLLLRLVGKQIWTEPRLWDGFALCASITAPTSFGALLQLPLPQLREVVAQKQPAIREPLRDYLIYKAGGTARHAELLALLEHPE
ncbi:hypothetical protein MSPP1_000044 [Malassezia sp. CBS 17886]|nr:hypothetical protein MSPP1_000044 [Malassezia sp. CBS 17886]